MGVKSSTFSNTQESEGVRQLRIKMIGGRVWIHLGCNNELK